ncbi:MAG: imidazole glycerol phosphate synthase subunit HisH [Candidatus Auribacterota bacterium]|nr:imidazole glycerol phosphate synthase subunit HisH [Candidatus Auribacterota bacterium]
MSDDKVLIIDYNVGNHQSVANALDFLGYKYFVSGRKEDILKADFYILPGVGAFGEAMQNLQQLGVVDILKREIIEKEKPILGICLGMQILAEHSMENGYHEGLGLIEGRVDKIEARKGFRVPHVGWNTLDIMRKDPLFLKTEEDTSFYFDHSYHFICKEPYIYASCSYGSKLIAAVRKNNIFGVQFHPEKSQNSGLKLFRCFFDYVKKARQGNKKNAL